VDFVGIHEKICQLLIPLRTPLPFDSSEEQRQHSKQQLIMRQVANYLVYIYLVFFMYRCCISDNFLLLLASNA